MSPVVDWGVTEDAATHAVHLHLPDVLSTEIVRASLTEVVRRITAAKWPIILVVNLKSVQRVDPAAPLVGAGILHPVVDRIEHLYIVGARTAVKVAAEAAARTIGLPFTNVAREPDLPIRS